MLSRFAVRPCLALLLLACISAPSLASGAADAPAGAPVPIENFFQSAQFSDALMSPDGRFVAMRVASKGSRATLATLELASMKVTPVAAFADADIGTLYWVNDKRLVFSLTDLRVAKGEVRFAPGVFAVDRDGAALRQLVERDHEFVTTDTTSKMLPWNTFVHGPIGKQEGNEVLVVQYEGYGKSVDTTARLQRLNTLTGRVVELEAPPNSVRWLVDQAGTPRIAVTSQGKLRAMHYNDPASGQWRKLVQFEQLSDDAIDPVFLAPDNTLIVRARLGKDKAALYRYDLAHNAVLPTALLASDEFDIDASFISDQQKLLGMRYPIDAEVTQWFDARMAASQKAVDALLPGTSNRILPSQRAQTPYLLVYAFSDQQPGLYFLFNTETRKLTRLGAQHPQIDPARMASKDMVHYAARDGLTIPAYLTMPPGAAKKNLPMVVLVHGGPHVRGGYWDWDPQAQFLASRGYVVFEPEYRGSTGFGVRHFKAGWKEWGLAMQNDVADGTRWAIAQGIADPKRICIAGASYGGYATLMGLINDPELYRCGIDWVGVTDLDLLISVGWSDLSDGYKKYGVPLLIGDARLDAARFNATSPLMQAARIKQPLLLAYGGRDERVPKIHGTKFYDAVKVGNADVEWLVYPEEGHGWRLPATQVDFWRHVEKFLARQIGQAH